MDSTGDQNSGAEPFSNNKLIIFAQTTISKVVTSRQSQQDWFLWDKRSGHILVGDTSDPRPPPESHPQPGQKSPPPHVGADSSTSFQRQCQLRAGFCSTAVWGWCWFLVAVDGDGENNSISLQNVFIVMSTKYFLPPQTVEVLSMQHPSSFGKHLKTTNRISLFLF